MKWGGKRGVIGRGRGKIKDLHPIFVLRRGLLREHDPDEIARLGGAACLAWTGG